MASRNPGSFSYDKLADTLRRVREGVHQYASPSNALTTLGALAGGPMVNSIMGATQGDIMTGLKPPPGVTDALAAAKAPPAAPQAPAAPQDPSVPALGGLGLFPAPGATPMDWAKMAQWKNPDQPAAPAPAPQPAAAPSPAPQASVPLPQPRPDAAPQAEPDMGFFQRNAMMMRDPITGAFIDPTGAATAQSVRGPDLIAKMMGYLSNKVA